VRKRIRDQFAISGRWRRAKEGAWGAAEDAGWLADGGRATNLIIVNIGFLGGRFDPVHFGHLGAAQDALAQHNLDRLVFVPTAQVPHQSQQIHAPAADRLAMLRLAIGSRPQFEVSEFELGRHGASYTIDSVRHFTRLHPRDRLFWIIGGDRVGRLHDWKDIGELATLAEFIVLARPGHARQSAADVPGLRLHDCANRAVEASSTELRERVRQGLPLDNFVPEAVAAYIARSGLYRQSPD
jgi:nicotinate-nucleotide adenylyltransferase